jgi:hypothetical protein
MSDITRAEFDALVQKVEEIHRMLKNWGGQPNVVMVHPYLTDVPPYPIRPFVVPCGVMPSVKGTGDEQ